MTVGRLLLLAPPAKVSCVTRVRCGKIQKESEFAASLDCGWLSWGVGLLLLKPLKWTFSALLGGGLVPPEEPYVVLDLVKVRVFASIRTSSAAVSVLSPLVAVSGEGSRGSGGIPPQPPGQLAGPVLCGALRTLL